MDKILQEAHLHIKFPENIENVNTIKQGFFEMKGLSNIIGCIDGSHVLLKAPYQDEPDFVNRHQTHSINCQIVCDHKYNFLDFVGKWPGSCHDSHIFRNSSVHDRFIRGDFGNSKLLGKVIISKYFALNNWK